MKFWKVNDTLLTPQQQPKWTLLKNTEDAVDPMARARRQATTMATATATSMVMITTPHPTIRDTTTAMPMTTEVPRKRRSLE